MKKIALVLVNEIITVITRPSFWLAAVGIPLIGAVIFGIAGIINRNAGTAATVSQIITGPQDIRPQGYVDLSGIIRAIPGTVPASTFEAFSDESTARLGLAKGEISAFYIVPADYIQKGSIIYIRPDFNPLATSGDQSGLFQWVLQVNLAGGDMALANLVKGPQHVQDNSLAPIAQPDENNVLAFWAPYAVTLIFYFLIMGSASLLLSSITKEKENRIMEILLTSVTPRQLLTGKILGLGIVGFGQTLLWVGTVVILMNLSGRAFKLPSAISFPPSFLWWGLVFFLLGYAVYASLMAGLGALAPNLREASQVTFVIMLPLIIPLFFSSTVFMQDPNGPIATGFSLFPLSAPVAMMARLSAGGVPWWHPVLAAILLAGTTVITVRAVANMFRAQALVSGQSIKAKTFFKALFGRI
jgi:ABC-2 type transport system permease protein